MKTRYLLVTLAAVLVLLLGTISAYALAHPGGQQNAGSRITAVFQSKKAVPGELAFTSFAGVTASNWGDRGISRREFLKAGGMGAAALLLGGGLLRGKGSGTPSAHPSPTYPSMNYPSPDYLFKLGVASGEPSPDGFVLWTRLAPNPLDDGGGMPPRNVPVRWELASDESFSNIVRSGTALAVPDLAHSVHVELDGLAPGRYYWYRFKSGDDISPTGRTKTAPASGSRLGSMRFAFASCQNWEAGYYPAYRAMAQEDLDLVFHLGDYIYQWAPMSDVVRHCNGGELVTLSDYRNRHALYKTDPDLQAAHAAHPWVLTWDNHDGWSTYTGLMDDGREGEAREALRAAYQAYYEHTPLRSFSRPKGSGWRLYRRLAYGDLALFNVLDARTYRTLPSSYGAGQRTDTELGPRATMTGKGQERWLLKGLEGSSQQARWNVIAQQVMMAQLDQEPDSSSEGVYDLEAWDGYVAQRKRILTHLQRSRTPNPIVISGDMHTSWVADLKADFDKPSSSPAVGTEFVGTSISSNCAASSIETYKKVLDKNPHIRYFDERKGGYVRCELTPGEWRTDLLVADLLKDRRSPMRTIASFVVEDGRPGAQGGPI